MEKEAAERQRPRKMISSRLIIEVGIKTRTGREVDKRLGGSLGTEQSISAIFLTSAKLLSVF